MEFLDKLYTEEVTEKSVNKSKESEGSKLDTVSKGLKQALELKDKTKLKDFVEGLDDSQKQFFGGLVKAKSTSQDKAIVSALTNKYPKLLEEDKDCKAFCEHVSNMVEVDKLSDGALKFLFERVAGKNIDDHKVAPQPEQEQEQEQEQPEAQEAEGQEGQEGQEPQNADGSPQDSNNSEMDFYDAWEDQFNDEDTELTEDDFSGLIDDSEIDEILGVDNSFSTADIALKFLKDKLYSGKEIKNTKSLALEFLMNR